MVIVGTHVRIPCIYCGKFCDTPNIHGHCRKCAQNYIIKRKKEYYTKKKAEGWDPAYRKKAGAKAYESRGARLLLKDPVKYQETLARIEEKDLSKARRIKRKAKKEILKRNMHYDDDIGKAIF